MASSKEEKIEELLMYGRELITRYNKTRDPFARLSLKRRLRQLNRVLSQGVQVYYKQKQYRRVIQFAELLLKVTEVFRAHIDSAVTHLNLGRTHRQLGEFAEAYSHFEKAHKLLQFQEKPELEAKAATLMASVAEEMQRS
jgi:tetratricopeptide (TPR) repeat protein